MRRATLITIFVVLFSIIEGGFADDPLGTFFYKEIGCTKNDGKIIHYSCPDFSSNVTCFFRNIALKPDHLIIAEAFEGSCTAGCACNEGGFLSCDFYDCWFEIKPGCSGYKYALDKCCPVDSVCGKAAKCKVDGVIYKEGERIYPKGTCDICICDKNFKQKAPFCRRMNCFDQTTNQDEIKKYGAAVFLEKQNCCPSKWIVDEGEEIIKMNPEAPADSKLSCKFGKRKVQLGYGFERILQPFGNIIPIHCECTSPPFVFCKEK